MRKKNLLHITICLSILNFSSSKSFAQTSPTDTIPKDPARISVFNLQNLNFGCFSQGINGGTVFLSPSGFRTANGDVVLLNIGLAPSQAIYEIDAPINTIISILNGPNILLIGSNGGSMIMSVGAADRSSPFITTVQSPSRTIVNIGGTLIVGNPSTTVPGSYSGTFYIDFIQE